MERQSNEGIDSGWFIGCEDLNHDHNNAENLSCISLYEAVLLYAPILLFFLALPPGSMVIEKDNELQFFNNEVQLEIGSDTFLEAAMGEWLTKCLSGLNKQRWFANKFLLN